MDLDLGAFPLGSKKLVDVLRGCTQEGGDVRILVNNAGVSHEMPVLFEDCKAEEIEGVMGVNNAGVLRVTKDVLPFMLNDKYPPLLSGPDFSVLDPSVPCISRDMCVRWFACAGLIVCVGRKRG